MPVGSVGHSQSSSRSGSLELQSPGSQGGAGRETAGGWTCSHAASRDMTEGTCGPGENELQVLETGAGSALCLFLLHSTTKVAFC